MPQAYEAVLDIANSEESEYTCVKHAVAAAAAAAAAFALADPANFARTPIVESHAPFRYRDSAPDRAHIQYLLGIYRVHVASTMNRCVDAGVQLRACIADAAAALMNVIDEP